MSLLLTELVGRVGDLAVTGYAKAAQFLKRRGSDMPLYLVMRPDRLLWSEWLRFPCAFPPQLSTHNERKVMLDKVNDFPVIVYLEKLDERFEKEAIVICDRGDRSFDRFAVWNVWQGQARWGLYTDDFNDALENAIRRYGYGDAKIVPTPESKHADLAS